MMGSRVLVLGIAASLALVSVLSSCSSGGDGRERPLPSLYFYTSNVGPVGGVYKGPAVVERSAAGELVLAFDPDPSLGGTLPRHATIHELGPTLFPVGAKVWLEKTPAVTAPFSFGTRESSSLSVFTEQDGRLLFGAANGITVAELSAAGVLALEEKSRSIGPYHDDCATGKIELTTLDVRGDATVAVADGETRGVRLDGSDHDVGIVARNIITSSVRCADYGGGGFFALSVRARDLATLVSTLELAQPPACARGTEVGKFVQFSLFNVSETKYEGPLFYTKRNDSNGHDCFQFSLQGATAYPSTAMPTLEICASPDLLAEPAVGEELWATTPRLGTGVLRRANGGGLIAASVLTLDVAGGPTKEEITQLLGIDAEVRPGCAYADTNDRKAGPLTVQRLKEAAFGAPAAVVVGSDRHAVVSIAGADYDVWMYEGGYFSLAAKWK